MEAVRIMNDPSAKPAEPTAGDGSGSGSGAGSSPDAERLITSPPAPLDVALAVARYETPLLRYVSQLLRSDRHEAQDLVQEVFLRLHRHVREHQAPGAKPTPATPTSYGGGSGDSGIADSSDGSALGVSDTSIIRNPSSWLFRVAHNLVMDRLRKKQRDQRVQQDAMDAAISGGSPSGLSAGDSALVEMEEREAAQKAMTEMHSLPDDYKHVLLLKFVGGLTLRQIGEVTGLSVGNAGYRVNQGLRELSRRLKEKGVI